jgi:hypothetical protein
MARDLTLIASSILAYAWVLQQAFPEEMADIEENDEVELEDNKNN